MRLYAAFLALFAMVCPVAAQDAAPAVSELPIRKLDMSRMPVPGFPPKQESSAWFHMAVSGSIQGICDPFGRFDTECSGAIAPMASVSGGGSYWGLWASGGMYPGPFRGAFGEATVRGQFVHIGPVAVGSMIEITGRSWRRDVFTSGSTTVGTSRNARAGFMGVDLSVGRFDRRFVSLAVLPGFWQSSYKGTANTGEPSQELAHQEYMLIRVRLEARNFPVSRRVHVSGSLERTSFYRNERHPVAAPFAPAVQWAFMPSASYRLWAPSRLTHFDIALQLTATGGGPSQLREQGVNIGLAWRFR